MSDVETTPGVEYPETYPPALCKACDDCFSYALGLKSGKTIYFNSADVISEEWVLIKPDMEKTYMDSAKDGDNLILDRGIEVRVSEIAWVADAPFGS